MAARKRSRTTSLEGHASRFLFLHLPVVTKLNVMDLIQPLPQSPTPIPELGSAFIYLGVLQIQSITPFLGIQQEVSCLLGRLKWCWSIIVDENDLCFDMTQKGEYQTQDTAA